MVLPGMGYLSKPTNPSHRTRHTAWQVCHSCHMPRCLGICVRQRTPWEVIYVCLKRGSLELFISNAIESNEDVNRKLPPLLTQSSSILTNKSLTMYLPIKLKGLAMTDHSCKHIFLIYLIKKKKKTLTRVDISYSYHSYLLKYFFTSQFFLNSL